MKAAEMFDRFIDKYGDGLVTALKWIVVILTAVVIIGQLWRGYVFLMGM